jgi:hemoglobin-like flavoprotein
MYNHSDLDHLKDILNTNTQITSAQKEALHQVITNYHPGINEDDLIEIIKIIFAILMMGHST